MFQDDLKSIINTIAEEHISINSGFKNDINLRNKTLKRSYEEGILVGRILSYMDFLNENTVLLGLRLSNFKTDYILRAESRVKQNNSAFYKIDRYIKGNGGGNNPINKCFNDLFGCRIIVNNDYELDYLLSLINKLYPDLKCTNASKNGYKAIHIYFHNGNFVFPWELQIWLQKDEENNRQSHKLYKQGYTEWEQKHHEGICI
ncbi:MAG: hypothetical protein ACI4WH_07580 [Oscillospiraceae bacterium]